MNGGSTPKISRAIYQTEVGKQIETAPPHQRLDADLLSNNTCVLKENSLFKYFTVQTRVDGVQLCDLKSKGGKKEVRREQNVESVFNSSFSHVQSSTCICGRMCELLWKMCQTSKVQMSVGVVTNYVHQRRSCLPAGGLRTGIFPNLQIPNYCTI